MSKTEEFIHYEMLCENLINNNHNVIGLFIAIVINSGLRYEDIKKLSWIDLIEEKNNLNIFENDTFTNLIKKVYIKINPKYNIQKFLLSRKKIIFSPQRINIILKGIDKNLTINSLRKIFARNYMTNSDNYYNGLIELQKIFRHSNSGITAKFIGAQQKKHRKVKGYCYIMEDELYPDWYKIGKAKDVMVRERTLLHHAPMLKMVKVVSSDDYTSLETKIHHELKEFVSPRSKEWFKLTKERINEVIKKYNFVDYE